MPVSSVNAGSGFYGKLPWLGDFVQRRLPQELVQAWDAYLSQLLPTVPGWNTADAEHIRPWAFLCAPGTCGDSAFAGVVAPGRDRVGRRFPLLIGKVIRADPDAGGLLRPGLPWFDAAWCLQAAVAGSAVAGIEEFNERVLGLDHIDGGSDDTVRNDEIEPALRQRRELWLRCLEHGGSVWWREAASPCVLSGMPQTDHCLQALRGDCMAEVNA